MKLNKLFIAISTYHLFASFSHAQAASFGLFAEPALTYELGKGTVNYPSPLTTSSGNIEGFGLGGRFGLNVSEQMFVALDARLSRPQYSDSDLGYTAPSASANWGPVVGLQMKDIGLRMWGGLVLGGLLDPESSGSLDVNFQEAFGYRLGVGVHYEFVSLNIEFQDISFRSTQLQQVGPFDVSSSFDKVNLGNKALVVSVSAPIEINF